MEVGNGRDVGRRQLGYPKEAEKEWEGGNGFWEGILGWREGRDGGYEGNSREAMWENWRQ